MGRLRSGRAQRSHFLFQRWLTCCVCVSERHPLVGCEQKEGRRRQSYTMVMMECGNCFSWHRKSALYFGTLAGDDVWCRGVPGGRQAKRREYGVASFIKISASACAGLSGCERRRQMRSNSSSAQIWSVRWLLTMSVCECVCMCVRGRIGRLMHGCGTRYVEVAGHIRPAKHTRPIRPVSGT